MFVINGKRTSICDGEPAALLMGRGRSDRSLRANILPKQDLVRTGEPPKIVVPRRQSTSQRAVFEWGRSPVRRAKRGYPRFLGAPRLALPRPAEGKRSAPAPRQSLEGIGEGQKRWVAALFAAHPARKILHTVVQTVNSPEAAPQRGLRSKGECCRR